MINTIALPAASNPSAQAVYRQTPFPVIELFEGNKPIGRCTSGLSDSHIVTYGANFCYVYSLPRFYPLLSNF